jgi:hypothetical protein
LSRDDEALRGNEGDPHTRLVLGQRPHMVPSIDHQVRMVAVGVEPSPGG